MYASLILACLGMLICSMRESKTFPLEAKVLISILLWQGESIT